jgi:glycosyltransferase involved in cell wall biosynthesis
MKKPLVSVCIPAYRQPDLVARAVNSVFSQSMQDFEVIITDDSDSNDVWNALVPWHKDCRLVYFRNLLRLGSPANWNCAMSLARADLIKIMHHDDWFAMKDALRQFVEAMQHDESIDLAFSASNAYGGDGRLISVHKIHDDQLTTLRQSPSHLQFANFIGAPSVTIFRKQDGFNFDENIRWVVDIDAYITLLGTNPKFSHIAIPIVNVTTNSAHQVTAELSNDNIGRIKEHFYLYRKRTPTTLSGRLKGAAFLAKIIAQCNRADIKCLCRELLSEKYPLETSIVLRMLVVNHFYKKIIKKIRNIKNHK